VKTRQADVRVDLSRMFLGPKGVSQAAFFPNRGGELIMSRYFACVLCVVAVLSVCGVAQASYISTVLGDNPAVFYTFGDPSGTGTATNLGTREPPSTPHITA